MEENNNTLSVIHEGLKKIGMSQEEIDAIPEGLFERLRSSGIKDEEIIEGMERVSKTCDEATMLTINSFEDEFNDILKRILEAQVIGMPEKLTIYSLCLRKIGQIMQKALDSDEKYRQAISHILDLDVKNNVQ